MKMKSILIMALLISAYGTFAQSDDDQRIMADAEAAKAKLQKMDNGLDTFFNNASGYVIFPNVGEGGFIVGAASGNGVLYENGEPVGMASLKKIDVGLQIGGQAIMEIIFFETEEALNEFKQDQFEVSAEISAVALEKGKSINANYDDGVVIFVKPKEGLMADLSVGGQKFEYMPMEDLER
ncbi:MAG TPA: lipid-binding SYLF domain-containing protein [Pricia sp.]|nr:lipid-binding SYLF domain-containing protein [Pricia sp.]